MIEDTKECPFCAEIIKAKAIKCKHCGSLLNGLNKEEIHIVASSSPKILPQTEFQINPNELIINASTVARSSFGGYGTWLDRWAYVYDGKLRVNNKPDPGFLLSLIPIIGDYLEFIIMLFSKELEFPKLKSMDDKQLKFFLNDSLVVVPIDNIVHIEYREKHSFHIKIVRFFEFFPLLNLFTLFVGESAIDIFYTNEIGKNQAKKERFKLRFADVDEGLKLRNFILNVNPYITFNENKESVALVLFTTILDSSLSFLFLLVILIVSLVGAGIPFILFFIPFFIKLFKSFSSPSKSKKQDDKIFQFTKTVFPRKDIKNKILSPESIIEPSETKSGIIIEDVVDKEKPPVICPKCNLQNQYYARFCKRCGEKFNVTQVLDFNKNIIESTDESLKEEENEKSCPYCGGRCSLNALFCRKCGKNFNVTQALALNQDIVESTDGSLKEEENEKSCPYCDRKCSLNALFCGKCGKTFE